MAFGRPTRYWMLKPKNANPGPGRWDTAVSEASEVYKGRMVSRITIMGRNGG